MLIYDTAPPLPHVRRATEDLVAEVASETAFHLRRWGVRHRTKLRARVLVTMTLRLVHHLAIRAPAGPAREQLRQEITRLAFAATET